MPSFRLSGHVGHVILSEHGLLSCIHRSSHHGGTHLLILLWLHLHLVLRHHNRYGCLLSIGVVWIDRLTLSNWIWLLHRHLTRSHYIGIALLALRWISSLYGTRIVRVHDSNCCLSTVAIFTAIMVVVTMFMMVRITSSSPNDAYNNNNDDDTAKDRKQDIKEYDSKNGLTIIIVVVIAIRTSLVVTFEANCVHRAIIV